jgi:2,5-diamino-6-(ribosylamino)-4(3H)-pyrimidinone 5'-phosphate reductase
MESMNRPYVLINVAMSADGKIDNVARKGMTISSSADKARVDHLRASMDAVLVGGRTLLDEDPKLTVKSKALRDERQANGMESNPIKVGVVGQADLDSGCNFLTAGPARRLIYTTCRTPPEQISRLEKAGAQVFVLGDLHVDLPAMLESLYNLNVRRLLVEGGGTLIAEFFRLGLVDELSLYLAPFIFGGASAPTLADGPGFLPDQAPILRLEAADEFDDDGGVFIHYTVVRKE